MITVGTGLLARSWISQRSQVVAAPVAAPQPPKAAQVLVAASAIPTGSFLQQNHLRWQAWPDEPLPDAYFVREEPEAEQPETKELIGAVVRRGFSAGEPITRGRIIKPGERGFLAAVLRPGYRAMAIRVDATSGIAGLVFPGDRVDLILTHLINKRRASETVLTNVRVLAIDQTVNDQGANPQVGKNATLELSPKQAEMLAIITDMGKLSLSLRSLAKDEAELDRLAQGGEPLAEPDPERGQTHTWDSEASRLLWRPSQTNQDVVQVSRGNEVQELRFNKSK